MDNSEEYRLDCLARWVNTYWKTAAQRKEFLVKMEKRHGAVFIADLKRRMINEWNKAKHKNNS